MGRALTEAPFQRARKAGCRKLNFWTTSPLSAAIRHYERLGFRKAEEVENHDWSLDDETLTEVKLEPELI
ncbi:MAG: GNAT family N-acetyltransferase [Oscillibacter sp.]|nr:GNAT family N-acetyltransferase [Oscillibacter sp.]MCI9002441.1 GNAT family N-acetyltransferase [Oscillibacter sp.]